MKTLMHLKRSGDSYFHGHPFHTMFSFIAGFVFVVLVVLMFALSAK